MPQADSEGAGREVCVPVESSARPRRVPTTTEVMWAIAEYADDPRVFGDLLVLLAWLECIGAD